MTKDKENKNDSLKDFIVDENIDEVEKRLDNREKNNEFNDSKDPWNEKKEENKRDDKDFSKKENSNSKNNSATKNYVILLIIIFSLVGVFFYLENNNSSEVKKNNEIITTNKKTNDNQWITKKDNNKKNKQTDDNEWITKKDNKQKNINNSYFNLNTATLKKIEYSAKWSEWYDDTVIITLKNNTNHTIKELEFWFIGKKCANTPSHDFWTNKIKKNFIVDFKTNTTINIKKNNLNFSNLCYSLREAKVKN